MKVPESVLLRIKEKASAIGSNPTSYLARLASTLVVEHFDNSGEQEKASTSTSLIENPSNYQSKREASTTTSLIENPSNYQTRREVSRERKRELLQEIEDLGNEGTEFDEFIKPKQKEHLKDYVVSFDHFDLSFNWKLWDEK